MPLDLKTIHQRIKDNIDVLCNFSTKREEGKERAEYMSLLKKDLCMYYSYNNFLIEKLIDLFPLFEVCTLLCYKIISGVFFPLIITADWCTHLLIVRMLRLCLVKLLGYFHCMKNYLRDLSFSLQLVDFLEANEIQRPVTIRTNTLKTRRRDLAQVIFTY